MLVKCKFIDSDGAIKGKGTAYETTDDVSVGEIVHTANGKQVIITEINAPHYEGKLSSVHKTIKPDIIDAEFTEITLSEPVTEFPDNDIDTELAIDVIQLPIIQQQLPAISAEITRRTEIALNMECSNKTIGIIKKLRASLNNTKKSLEQKRIAAKQKILEGYENDFLPEYKQYVTDILDSTDATLKKRIDEVEGEVKQNLQDGAESYFYEYAASKDIGWIKWEDAEIKIGVSDNPTALRRSVKTFIDKVYDDLELIGTQENKAEILVEYHKDLNISKAIKTVQDRIKAIKIQEELQAAAEQRKKEQEEARRIQAEKLEQARQESLGVAPGLGAPVTAVGPERMVEITPTIQEFTREPKSIVAFKVNDTRQRIIELVKYLKDNGYEYVQVPLKNIKEED